MPPSDPSGRARAGNTAQRTRQRQPPDVRRAMIIDAAREPIAAQGMHATTIRDIAAAAGVAVGTVTYHFSGIAEVLAGVLQAEMTQFSAAVMDAADTAATGAAGLQVLTDGLVADGPRAAGHWKLWLDFWTLAARRSRYAEWQKKVYRDLHGLAASLFGRDGAANPERCAIEYIALMDGLVVQTYLPGSRLTAVQARALLDDYVTHAFARRD
jgi:AcrR family transcriptional regulator